MTRSSKPSFGEIIVAVALGVVALTYILGSAGAMHVGETGVAGIGAGVGVLFGLRALGKLEADSSE